MIDAWIDKLKLTRKSHRVSVSFSGGRTSGLMAYIIKNWADKNGVECVFTFANTGLEHEGTYDFVEACDKAWGLNVVWVEAKVNPTLGKGVRHNIVNFKTAERGVGCFASVASKYGLPSQANPHCTTYLKVYPMQSYLRSIGFKKSSYLTCIGIRADEMDRVNSKYEELGLWYPLCDLRLTKKDVKEFWDSQTFDLVIPEHYGNCQTCWKKSKRKLFEIYKQTPEAFDPFLELDRKFHTRQVLKRDKSKIITITRKMFRGNVSTKDLLAEAKDFLDGNGESFVQTDLDLAGACDESCEVYSEEHLAFLGAE